VEVAVNNRKWPERRMFGGADTTTSHQSLYRIRKIRGQQNYRIATRESNVILTLTVAFHSSLSPHKPPLPFRTLLSRHRPRRCSRHSVLACWHSWHSVSTTSLSLLWH